MVKQASSAKSVAIMAMTAALYAIFFYLSYSIAVPNFTLLYLPIILLGVFPLWFGWSGLAGCMIGAFIGGVFVEGLPLHFAWAEAVTALIIYGLNWLLISKRASEAKTTLSFPFVGVCVDFVCGNQLHPLAACHVPSVRFRHGNSFSAAHVCA